MGKYQAYPVYRKGRHQLLPRMPTHWMTGQIKYAHSVVLGKMLQSDAKSPADRLLPYLRAANVNWGGVELDDVKEMWFSPAERKSLRLEVGDVVISEGGDVGRSAVWQGELAECCFQNAINRARPRGAHSSRYLFYWMNFIKSAGYIDIICNKSTIAHYTAEKVQATPFAFPPHDEQEQIAAFLDHETAKIDRLIARQERLIELLKEKGQAVISHAVTKGLNPDAPMKNSGVEWLGEVPAHWGICALGYLGKIDTGATPDRSNPSYWGGDIPWLKTGEVNYKVITESEEHITEEGLVNSSTRLAEEGTLLMAMYGQGVTRGRVAILGIKATYNQACAAIRVGKRLINEYAYFYLMAAYDFIRGTGNETSQMNLSSEIIGKIKIVIPPVNEQLAIVEYLKERLPSFDVLADKVQRSIDLSKEHRTALISAAVTGKIDVRGWQKPNTEPQETATAVSA